MDEENIYENTIASQPRRPPRLPPSATPIPFLPPSVAGPSPPTPPHSRVTAPDLPSTPPPARWNPNVAAYSATEAPPSYQAPQRPAPAQAGAAPSTASPPLPSQPPPLSSQPPPIPSQPPPLSSQPPPLPSQPPPLLSQPPHPSSSSSSSSSTSSRPARPPRVLPQTAHRPSLPTNSLFSPSPLDSPSALYSPSPIYSPSPLYSTPPSQLGPSAGASGVESLEQGLVVTVFSLNKRKPEKIQLHAVPDLFMLQCVHSLKDRPDITVDLAQVQEIRTGRRCADFDRWPEEANKAKNELCLVLFYGIEALPQTLAVAATKQEDFYSMLTGVTYLVETVRNQTYQAQRQMWFRRQFHGIVCPNPARKKDYKQEKMTIKQLRQWLLKNGLKATKKHIMPIIHTLSLSDTLKYGGFVLVISEITTAHSVMKKLTCYNVTHKGVQCVTPASFLKFLKQEQNEAWCTELEAQAVMDQYLEGKELRASSGPRVMDLSEFEDFLFCPLNSVCKPEVFTVHQDMTQPLTDYWVSSSHNTYLVSHQWVGLSSEQMYARCLRMGCRCLELDCWDGADGEPIITHGKTLVSKIKVADVLKIIKENAWQTSEYPIILSIENHLSLHQQRYLASLMQDIFKDELLREPADSKETEMPSPEKLKRKVILKDKKLSPGTSDSEDFQGQKDSSRTGTLWMKDPDDQTWYVATVVLTDTTLFYSNVLEEDDEEEAEEDIDHDEYFHEVESDEDEDDLKYQPWYYGDVGKREVKKLLKPQSSLRERRSPGAQAQGQALQDGAFLVRKSEGGDNYSLSFIWKGDVKHVRVRTKTEDGCLYYTFGNEVWRPTVAELVKYFRNHRLYIANENTHLYLDKPVCKPHERILEDWFKPDMNRYEAEQLLLRIPKEGVFLVRGSSDPGCLSLSFRHKHNISHFQVFRRGKSYVCGPFRFVSLQKMVEYFRRRPLYRKTKLTYAAKEDLATGEEDGDCGIYACTIYSHLSEVVPYKTVSVRALYDFMGREEENEMSFTRGAVITNVKEEDKSWWKGDYLDQKQKAFPASYVQVLSGKEDTARKQSICDTLRKEDKLDLIDCTLDNGPYIENDRTLYCFRVEHPRHETAVQMGCRSLLELEEWVTSIRDKQQRAHLWNREQQKQEKNVKRARELSDLIVYCQAVTYNSTSGAGAGAGRYYHVSSLSEEKVQPSDVSLLQASRQQMLRVFPKWSAIKSSNYDPVPKWTCGAQMVALNYQTPGREMQLNQARFLTNGRCGYVLKPAFMRSADYSQDDILRNKVPTQVLLLTVTVLAGRNLCPAGRAVGVVRPFVAVEVVGLPSDNARKRTKAVDEDNALKPQWPEEKLEFDVSCQELAFLRFEVLSETSDTKTVIAQATYPVTALRQGYRSVPLQNGYSEVHSMSSLLVHLEIKNPKDAEEENLFRVIEECRRYRVELSQNAARGAGGRTDQLQAELLKTENKILGYLQNRQIPAPSSARNGR